MFDYIIFPSIKVPSKYSISSIVSAVFIFCLFIQVITGILLAMHYNSSDAFNSIEVMTNRVFLGWLLRNIHITGVTCLFICAYLLLFLGIYNGDYQRGADVVWFLFISCFLLLCAIVFLGYVLPWGQMSYWGATVITSVFGVFSETFKRWFLGDYALSEVSLIRFTALHYIMPFILLGFICLYGFFLWCYNLKYKNYHVYVRDCLYVYLFFIIIVAIIASYFIFFNIDFLLSGDNYFERDKFKTPLVIMPEWYFLPYYSILKAIPYQFLGAVMMVFAMGIYIILPLVDYTDHNSWVFKIFFYLLIISILVLCLCSLYYDNGYGLYIMRVCILYYFSFFTVILPGLSLFQLNKQTIN
ncbi:MAG: cytochrome b N-terminal domain-containing protein [Pseudomonadota bacterium]